MVKDGVKPDLLKVLVVKEFPRLRTSKNIKQFLGLAGYYRRFISNFSKIVKSWTNLLKKDEKFVWNEAQDKAFRKLRDLLCSEALVLRFYQALRGNHGCVTRSEIY